MSIPLISAFTAGVAVTVGLQSLRPMDEPRYGSRTHQFWHSVGSYNEWSGQFEVVNSGRVIIASGAACTACGRVEPRAFLPADADVYVANKFVRRQPWLERDVVVRDEDLSVPLPSDILGND